ncbi:isochorismatase family protein [Candidatus Pacearchaeota archaeon]|nr:hypothetical protein [uncultured archaeon]MBS3078816.1 isochorismatase family protein [Candidatus Pacearchaeota archaeon]
MQPTDQIIYVGIDAETHRTPNADEHYPYPKSDFIMNQLGNVGRLVVSGFHLHSCVKKVARRAFLRGINVLVDEELTELFPFNLKQASFRPDTYPSINPFDIIKYPEMLEYFIRKRKRQPWLYQWQSR